MDSDHEHGVESSEPEQVVQYVIRLPCGHLFDEPKGSVHIECKASWGEFPTGGYCGRKWYLYRKGAEQLAREES